MPFQTETKKEKQSKEIKNKWQDSLGLTFPVIKEWL